MSNDRSQALPAQVHEHNSSLPSEDNFRRSFVVGPASFLRGSAVETNSPSHSQPSYRSQFPIAIICALPIEYDAVCLTVDHFWDETGIKYGRASGDTNTYRNVRIGRHNVVLVLLPGMGKATVAGSAASLRASYPNLRLVLLVGVCGGVPSSDSHELLLGDVLIGDAIIQYDFGRQYPNQFMTKGSIENISKPNKAILSHIAYFKTESGNQSLRTRASTHLDALQVSSINKGYRNTFRWPGCAEDKLFPASYLHIHRSSCGLCSEEAGACDEALISTCAEVGCDENMLVPRQRPATDNPLDVKVAQTPEILVGRLASGDTVMKSGRHRDRISQQYKILGFEMEGAGAFDEVPSVVVKGVCDYSDSHKNKKWQPFAAATAAAVAKAMLEQYAEEPINRPTDSPIVLQLEPKEPEYAKDIVNFLTNDSSYWVALRGLATSIPDESRISFLSTQDLKHNLFPQERVSGPEQRTIESVPNGMIQTASVIMDKLDRALESASVTLEGDLAISLLALTRGAVLKSIRLGLKREAYFRPIVNGMTVLIDYLTFVGLYTLDDFARDPRIQAVFLNAYRSIWSIPLKIYYFSTDDFGNEIHLSRENRWETRWKTVKDHFIRIQLMIASDAAFALNVIRTGAQHELPTIDAMEHERGRIMNQLDQMDEEAEKARLEDRRKMLLWISDLEYHTAQAELFGGRVDNTGLWLLQREEFVNWFNNEESSILWCHGSPGIGKTILCSVVHDYISRSLGEAEATGFAVAYCTFREPKPPAMYILSYLRQLLSHLTHVPPGIQDRYYELCRSARGLIQSDLEVPEPQMAHMESSYTHVFTYVLERFKRVHLTFDAMDECSDRKKWLLPFFCRLIQRYRQTPALGVCVKIFVTSRQQRDIEAAFQSVPTVQVLARNVDSDIHAYVRHELLRRFQDGTIGSMHMQVQDHIMSSLTSKANGMFLWVKYQLDDICEQFTVEGIMAVLGQLPETLHGYYDRVINAIDSQSTPVRNMATVAIKCIAGCLRRLTTSELCAAIDLQDSTGASSNRLGLIELRRIVHACHNIVAIHPDGTLGFVHYSVQEYFASDYLGTSANSRLRQYSINVRDERFNIALACLRCLREMNSGLDGNAFHSYAYQELAEHLQLTEPQRLSTPLFTKLFVQGFQPRTHGTYGKASASPIQLAAQLGLYGVVSALLRSRHYSDMEDLERALRLCRDGYGESYAECQRLLLEVGVHIGASSPRITMPSFTWSDSDDSHDGDLSGNGLL